MYQRIENFFLPKPTSTSASFDSDMERRASRMIPLYALIGLLSFLPYISLDRLIFPDVPQMLYLRWGLPIVSGLCLVAYFIPFFKSRGRLVMAFFATYLFFATALITAFSGAHPAYMGGFALIMMTSLVSMLDPRVHYPVVSGSFFTLLLLLYIRGDFNWESPTFRYSIFDITAAWLVTSIFYALAHNIRKSKYLKFQATDQKRKFIERNSERITSSLRYAERIQSVILGEPNHIFRFFRDSFLLNRPRDMVSGDFYWSWNCQEMATGIAESVRQRFSQLIIVGDCTGHGVPAGFMTVLMVNFLDTIVKREGILSPNELLHHLDERMLQVFKEESSPVIHGGADLTAVLFSYDYRHVWYSGAKNPLILGRNGRLERKTVSRFSIGSYYKKELKEFMIYDMPLLPGDQLYLLSDGYQDQYSPIRQKKLSRKTMMETLEKNLHKEMSEQHEILEKTLVDWMGEEEQTDDIIILGIQV